MTKFELARTAGRWRLRSRTYVALAILVVAAWPTSAGLFHDAFRRHGPASPRGAWSEFSLSSSAQPSSAFRLTAGASALAEAPGSACAQAVCEALTTEAMAATIRSGGVW